MLNDYFKNGIIIFIIQLIFLNAIYNKNIYIASLTWFLSIYLIMKNENEHFRYIIPLLTVVIISNCYRTTSIVISQSYLAFVTSSYLISDLKKYELVISTIYIVYSIILDQITISHFQKKRICDSKLNSSIIHQEAVDNANLI